jgi:hypothetical protein
MPGVRIGNSNAILPQHGQECRPWAARQTHYPSPGDELAASMTTRMFIVIADLWLFLLSQGHDVSGLKHTLRRRRISKHLRHRANRPAN